MRKPPALVVTLLLLLGLLSGCASLRPPSQREAEPEPPAPSSAAPSTPASASASASASGGGGSADGETVSCKYPVSQDPARAVDPPNGENVPASGTESVTLTTNEGPVTIAMDRANAPCAVHSFESLATQKYFDDTTCHRLVDSGIFVLQCGDPSGSGQGGPGYTFADELTGEEKYTAGTVAMANAGPDTNGSQFFLVYDDSLELPPSYTILGRMDEKSTGVVARISAEGQDGSSAGGGGKPNNPAEIEKVTLG